MNSVFRQTETDRSQERAALFGSLFCSAELTFLDRACHWLTNHFTAASTELLAPEVPAFFSFPAEESPLTQLTRWPRCSESNNGAANNGHVPPVLTAAVDGQVNDSDCCSLALGDRIHDSDVCRYELNADHLTVFLPGPADDMSPRYRLTLRVSCSKCNDVKWRDLFRSEYLRIVLERSRIELDRYRESRRLASEVSTLQSAISCFPGLVFAKDLNLRYVVVNNVLCEYAERSAEQICGSRFEDLPIKDPLSIIDETDRQAANGEHVSREHDLTYPRGTRFFRGQKSPILDNNGKQIGICGVYHDITDLREAESRLQQANAFQAAVIEKASEGVVVVRLHDQGRRLSVLLWNRRLTDITGVEEGDPHLAERLGSLFTHNWTAAMRSLARIYRGQHLEQEEWSFAHPDGQERIAVVSSASIDSDGAEPTVVFFVNDITRRHYIQRTLKENKQRYELATKYSGSCIWEWHAATKAIEHCTLAETLGYQGQPFRTLDEWMEKIHLEDQPHVQHAWQRFLGRETLDFRTRMRMRHASGEWRWIDCQGQFLNSDPLSEIVIGTDRDITDQMANSFRMQELQDEMQKLSRLTTVSEMAASLAHEITQPVTAIRSYAAAARKLLEQGISLKDGADIRRYVAKIEENAKNATEMMHVVRSLCSPAAMEVSWNVLGDIADKALEVCNSELRKQQIEVRRVPAADDQQVRVSASLIVHVLMNLISNSCDALEEMPARERTITLATAVEDEKPVILLSDNGPGISRDIRDSLFQPFVTTKPNGMGVGLAICKRIMDAHNGEIMVRDCAGSGVTFCLQFA